ncbi:MAG: hypothetical protein J5577_07460 [Bacteroidales bacterium]|nr:hypothetical protein [Bacteroidales bacterium]MBR4817388.1 hypothetical protein [Bacteroidales bacterium]
MKVFLLALAVILLCVFGMCFNIIFRKGGEFPEYEVSKNKEMRRLGIRCMHEEDALSRGKKAEVPEHCSGEITEACEGCALYKEHKL